jgi:hypothetical protein
MKYPDGRQVSLGDHVWWNEGSSIGFIHVIVESEEEIAKWGFEEPHILLSGFHPAEPDGGGYVAYRESDFSDECIMALSLIEEDDFAKALESAKDCHKFTEPYHVRFDSRFRDWIFEEFRKGSFYEFARSPSTLAQAEHVEGGKASPATS